MKQTYITFNDGEHRKVTLCGLKVDDTLAIGYSIKNPLDKDKDWNEELAKSIAKGRANKILDYINSPFGKWHTYHTLITGEIIHKPKEKQYDKIKDNSITHNMVKLFTKKTVEAILVSYRFNYYNKNKELFYVESKRKDNNNK